MLFCGLYVFGFVYSFILKLAASLATLVSRLDPAGGHVHTGASRPKGNRPAPGGQVNGRFAPERKPACARLRVVKIVAPV